MPCNDLQGGTIRIMEAWIKADLVKYREGVQRKNRVTLKKVSQIHSTCDTTTQKRST